MAEFLTFDTDLTAVANAIRAKGGTSAQLIYPSGFVSAIQASRPALRRSWSSQRHQGLRSQRRLQKVSRW